MFPNSTKHRKTHSKIGELKDYCHLMAVLRDSISPKCVCVLDGINWDNPPKSPEKLPEVWEEVSTEIQKQRTTTRTFKHKLYGFKLNFDTKPPSHWHRFNPSSQGKHDFYLDKNCVPVLKGSKPSHIYTP